MTWIVGAAVALAGLAHGMAAWLYFSRERWGWLWPLGWALATAACLLAVARGHAASGYGLFAGLVALWTFWWIRIRPLAERNWEPENRYQATASIVGSRLTIHNVRNFSWTTKRSFIEAWEPRSYDLNKLCGLDLFCCTWGDPRIAHIMVSFDFTDQPPLCFSMETRREVGERWTALAGFMKSYELLMLAADERDVIKSRSNVRHEDVRLYRIVSSPEMRRHILTRYAAQMNRLARRPRFYNTVFANCTLEVTLMLHAAGRPPPLDWRLFVSGHVPELLYDLGLLDRSRPFAELRAEADITARSQAADTDPDYSARIRAVRTDPESGSETTDDAARSRGPSHLTLRD